MIGKLLAGAGSLALAVMLAWLYGDARYHQGEQAAQLVDLKAGAVQQTADQQRVTDAVSGYADRAAALKPIIITSHDSEVRYAESPAGRMPCRDADRVRQIDALDASLFPTVTAGEGAGAVPADAAAPPAERHDGGGR